MASGGGLFAPGHAEVIGGTGQCPSGIVLLNKGRSRSHATPFYHNRFGIIHLHPFLSLFIRLNAFLCLTVGDCSAIRIFIADKNRDKKGFTQIRNDFIHFCSQSNTLLSHYLLPADGQASPLTHPPDRRTPAAPPVPSPRGNAAASSRRMPPRTSRCAARHAGFEPPPGRAAPASVSVTTRLRRSSPWRQRHQAPRLQRPRNLPRVARSSARRSASKFIVIGPVAAAKTKSGIA